MVSIRYISQSLKILLVGKTEKFLCFAISHHPIAGIFSGAVVTSAVQSSSTTTSLAVPLVGSGSFSLKQIYPFMVGANIGTTTTALLVGITLMDTSQGLLSTIALQAALIHVLFNVFAAVIIMCVPVVKNIPLYCAQWVGRLAAKNRLIALGYTLSMFVIFPILVFSTVFIP